MRGGFFFKGPASSDTKFVNLHERDATHESLGRFVFTVTVVAKLRLKLILFEKLIYSVGADVNYQLSLRMETNNPQICAERALYMSSFRLRRQENFPLKRTSVK